ncbi:hypothetical protein RJT34_25264 [Clitoria ternatea]|uniref:Uncharacterized protein n=1 Tax=Clitoria ternatea TaxID=43366 RepID=A0AAN9FPG9_CLITE
MDKSIRSFFWSQGMSTRSWHLLSWDVLTTSKRNGGLGLCPTRDANVALLGKSVASLTNKDEKGAAYVWQSLVLAKNHLKEGFDDVKLGAGMRIGQGLEI